jgi:hypothetical protein
MNENSRIKIVFAQLMDLIKTGQFTAQDLDFMETFLVRALEATRKLKEAHGLPCRVLKFSLSDKERETATKWQTEHQEKCGPFKEVTGARWQFSFTPTGIGVLVHVRCLKCQEEYDCTYYPTIEELGVRRVR